MKMITMTHQESKLTLDIIDELKRERYIWKSRADAHEQNYLAMLKRIDVIAGDLNEERAKNKELLRALMLSQIVFPKCGSCPHGRP